MTKTFRLTIAILLFHMAAHAQFVNIPDTGFKSWLIRLYPTCFNTAGQMDTTRSEIVNERSLIVYAYVAALPNWQVYNVYNLEGLQYFKNLQTLKIEAGFVTNIPLFPATIKTLTLENARLLSAIPPLPAGLQRLNYSFSSTNTLPPLPPALKHLEITNNLIREIPVLPEGLQYLSCHDNARLVSFPVLPGSLQDLEMYLNDSLNTHPVLPALLKRLGYASSRMLNLPALPDNLKLLDIGGPNIINLPALPSGLDSLRIAGSKITTLPLLPAGLRYLYCADNAYLTTIPNLPPNLKRLECQSMRFGPNNIYYGYGQITNLPPLPNSLVYLNCTGNLISSISQIPPAMDTLWCAHNRFTQLPTTPNGVLKVLLCDSNLITELPVLPKTTREIRCNYNLIQRIVSLPDSLRILNCEFNSISELPPLPTGITRLHCYRNNIYCLPKIPTNPFGNDLDLLFDSEKVKCIPNYPNQRAPGYTFSRIPLPLCNPTNNPSHCSAFPVMSGTVFYDINGNEIRDAGEPAKANTRIALSNNNYTITDNNGRYEIGTADTGRYSISITAPTYYDAVPSSIQYRFNTYDTLVTGNFALQANTAIDSAAINLNPGNWAARPGFAYSYIVGYENAGTTTLSPNIVLDYDETRLTYDSSSVPLVVNNGGRLSLPFSNFLPGQRRYFIAYFRIKTTALRGDSLQATATIDNGNVLALKRFAMMIGGSYDPNDKQGTPALTPAQVASGDYIDYTIRFQNTGTDTAFTVVISDTLSSDLQANTLELVNASHSCNATVKNNTVFFEFSNILLPDSNVNELKSHGFVSFKIKPRSTIAVNSNINNKAAIYFDYNAPVITNTAVTAIRNPVVTLPLHLMSFTAARATANTALLEWNTANEFNSSQFIIQQSLDGRTYTNCGNEAARNGQYNFYRRFVAIPTEAVYLRLKMLDVDGQFTYSPVALLRKQGIKAAFTILNNPVKGMLNIEVADAALYNTKARLINAQGVVVQTQLLQHSKEQMDVNELPPGAYVLQTQAGSSRLIITR